MDSVGEGEGRIFSENSIETCILSRVKQITSPGWMHETSAQDWCTGKTERDGVWREVEGGIRMGNTCKSMADSCQCMEKPLQYCKVISLQLIQRNGKKIRFMITFKVEYLLRKKKTTSHQKQNQGKQKETMERNLKLYSTALVQFSHSVMSNSLLAHEPQLVRTPCPLPTQGVHTNSCPLSQ